MTAAFGEAEALVAGAEVDAVVAGGAESSAAFSTIDGAGGEIGSAKSLGDMEVDDSGDGSDDDLDAIAEQAAEEAIATLHEMASNPGMDEMASMMENTIYDMADGLTQGEEPDDSLLYADISGVHSDDTAASCMAEGIDAVIEILSEALETMREHEASEGNSL